MTGTPICREGDLLDDAIIVQASATRVISEGIATAVEGDITVGGAGIKNLVGSDKVIIEGKRACGIGYFDSIDRVVVSGAERVLIPFGPAGPPDPDPD